MTKRELLMQICEQPGFEADESSMHARFTEELNREGWIQRRGNGMREGWEATPRALDEYPDFFTQPDIAGMKPEASAEPEVPPAPGVSRERAVIFVRSLLVELPMDRVAFHAAQVRGSLPSSPAAWHAWQVAEDIVDNLLGAGQ